MKKTHKGFTLVELAIVVTIIGILIGGVLKGQEMIETSRIVSSGVEIKSMDAAVKMFQQMYKNLPGDMPNPATSLKNCSSAPCNIAGDGDSWIGSKTTTAYNSSGEPNTFWAHLKAADLLQGVAEPASDGVIYTPISMSNTGYIMMHSWVYKPGDTPLFPDGQEGKYWWYLLAGNSTGIAYDIPVNKFAQYDLKFDDGKPLQGDALVNGSGCGVSPGDNVYDLDNANACAYQIRPAFAD